ncbi:methylmalonyl Co-A mutase-associated GTPase MeaB [Roseivirga sp. BDSF3-8]|uniref:methylmalonyl Co-A mutase-associated GTPase MeaB n=1 Tax=Roseivirga sp. BDSF3-8 TaxID=3241598 RepID=UPI003531A677
MAARRKNRLSLEEYREGILNGDRITLGRAITLVESTLTEDREMAEELLDSLMPETGKSIRIGITGVPGVGKSTFIESFGTLLTGHEHKVAVLAIDPSSRKTGGSIMGDKTRMEELSHDPNAFIRPSSTGTTLGGVAGRTREAMLLCEASGFDIIFIETVGVGQSETAVHGMVDFFLLLMLAGAGDELQGIKKGIMEMADGIVITKADGDNLKTAKKAKQEYQNALHLFPTNESGWYPKVLTCSAMKSQGLTEVWELIEKHHKALYQNGFFDKKRKDQQLQWMQDAIEHQLIVDFYASEQVKGSIDRITSDVLAGNTSPGKAARDLLRHYRNH